MVLIHIVSSNRMEVLRQTLIELLRQPVGGPFDEEIVIVPNRGLGRWLEMGLATDQGICAQTRMDFPRRLVSQILDSAFGTEPAQDAYQPEAMRWALYQIIPKWLTETEVLPLATYWEANPAPASRLALCDELARIFDLAIIYRPQRVLRWGQEPKTWQESLFAELMRNLGPDAHLAARIERYMAQPVPVQLPERISLFGVGCLPESFMGLIHAAARREGCFVYQFQLSPSPGLFEDAKTARQQHGLLAGGQLDESIAHLSTIHPLLASWGGVARAQQAQNIRATIDVERPLFLRPEGEGVLPRLQRDLCDLIDRLEEPRNHPPPLDDRSFRIHHCHGALREVEVLKDQILDLLERHPDLEPQDIAVLSTDPNTYGPLIQAVFAPELFVAAADLRDVEGEDLAAAISRALEIAEGPLDFDSVIELLHLDVLQRHWRFRGDDVEDYAQLFQQAGVQGARDAGHRQQINQAGGDARTWKRGLERLALGLMLPSGFDRVVQDCVPVDPGDPDLLVTLVSLLDALFALQGCLQEEHPAELGISGLEAALVSLLGPRVSRELGSVFDGVRRQVKWSAEGCPLPVTLLAKALRTALMPDGDEGQFLTGGVTVGGLQPLRSVPYEAIYVLGLGASDQPFPRSSQAGDLQQNILGRAQPGDRDERQEDLDLFLHIILSARRELGLFVSSISAEDGSEAPVSVVVDQLLDLIMVDASSVEEKSDIDRDVLRQRWVVHHPLQPFDRRAFSVVETGGSFSDLYRQLPQIKEFGWRGASASRPVSLKQLGDWYRDSLAAALLMDLGLRLRPWVRPSQDAAQQALTAALRYRLVTMLLQDPRKDQAWLEASGYLTSGNAGALQARQLVDIVNACPLEPFEVATPLQFDLKLSDWHLTGQLSAQAIVVEPGRQRPPLRAWLEHVVRQVVVGPSSTRLLCAGKGKNLWSDQRLQAMDGQAARLQLERFLQLYDQGLRDGWVFLDEVMTAFATARAESTKPANRDPWNQARQVWWQRRDWTHFRRCLGPEAPLPGENEPWFEQLIEQIFLPAYEGMTSS